MLKVKSIDNVVTFPTAWSELTLLQYLRLTESDMSVRGILESLASDVTALHLLRDIGAGERIISELNFLNTIPNFRALPVPQTVLGVVPPKDVGLCTLLQKWDADTWIEELQERHGEGDENYQLPYTLATLPLLCIYLAPELTKQPYAGLQSAKELSAVIGAIPVTVAFPLGGFFLRRQLKTVSSGMVSFQVTQNQRLRNSLQNWLSLKWDGLKRISA